MLHPKIVLYTSSSTAAEMEEIGRAAVIDSWLKKHRSTYLKATRHSFIIGIRDGSVQLSSFKRWLGQDYIFVRAFVHFVASTFVKAWKESDDNGDTDVILSGIAALNDEVSWFKREASKWEVDLHTVVPQHTNLEYCRFLESLTSPEVNYAEAITAFWAIEAVYQDSFAHCLENDSKTPQELKETCQRWGNDGFGQYCRSLQSIANRRLEKASDEVIAKAEVILLKILDYEVEFWNMSHGTV
ncbi:hypothetical protein ACS0TY_023016 [Phlomoides rotata]